MFVILNPFDRPFGWLMVPSNVEGLKALSTIEGEVKNLMISTEQIIEILRLSPQNDIRHILPIRHPTKFRDPSFSKPYWLGNPF